MKNSYFIAKTSLFFLFIFLLGCGGGGKEKEGNKVSGTFSTDFGDLTLTQEGDKVTGSYEYKGDDKSSAKGTLKGELKGQELKFEWEQKQGPTMSKGTGVFTFAADFKSFTGSWKDTKDQTGAWNGKK